MKFILTRELGRLVKWLRILGFDSVYFNQDSVGSLIIEALRDNRIIVTRNQRLPKKSGLRIVCLESELLKEQIKEVLKTLHIQPDKDIMFSRCIVCNAELKPIEKEEVRSRIPPYVFRTQQGFVTCPQCNRIYWQGTHWGNVQRCLGEIQSSA
jgi:uncharacterized protein with PIN domain